MAFSYRFSNVLGAVYRKGKIEFTNDSTTVISPVGSRIVLFDLKRNRSETFGCAEATHDILHVALSPNGLIIIIIDEAGIAYICSTQSQYLLRSHHFNAPINHISFSPDGSKVAVCKNDVVLVYHAPGFQSSGISFNPFKLFRLFLAGYDDTTFVNWSADSRFIIVASKDSSARIFSMQRLSNFPSIQTLGAHRSPLVGCFWAGPDDPSVFTLSKGALLNVWKCDNADSFEDFKVEETEEESSGSSEGEDDAEMDESEVEAKKKKRRTSQPQEPASQERITYRLSAKHYFNPEGTFNDLTCTDYHPSTQVLVTGFASGCFYVHEMPSFTLLQNFSLTDGHSVTSIKMNETGEWVALGSSGLGQLIVWEWRSERIIMKQQAHSSPPFCVAFSPDGSQLASGGQDSKLKLWNTLSSFCFVTFDEHSAAVTGVVFTPNGKVVLSSSLDGTVRAFDLTRYRNFRTFASPRPAQFTSISVDSSGDLIVAGATGDSFEAFVWSLQTGRLLDILSGHQSTVSSVAFNPLSAVLATTSWDKTVRIWDIFDRKGKTEPVEVNDRDIVTCAFKPDGLELAVATLGSKIAFINLRDNSLRATMDCEPHLGSGRRPQDILATALTLRKGKSFRALRYTADGTHLLAAGDSRYVCVYDTTHLVLVNRFEISRNLSLDGSETVLDRKDMTEFGNKANIKTTDPGIRIHDRGEIKVNGLAVSPTNRSFAVATTEGLMMYSLDHLHDVCSIFDPFQLSEGDTPAQVLVLLGMGEGRAALLMALALNQAPLIRQTLESFASGDKSDLESRLDLLSQSLSSEHVHRTLSFIAQELETTHHFEFYVHLAYSLLKAHALQLKRQRQHQKLSATPSSGMTLNTVTVLAQLDKTISGRGGQLIRQLLTTIHSLQYFAALNSATSVFPESSTDPDSVELVSDASRFAPELNSKSGPHCPSSVIPTSQFPIGTSSSEEDGTEGTGENSITSDDS